MLLGDWFCLSGIHGFYSKRPLTLHSIHLFKQTNAELGYGGYRPVLNQDQATVAQGDISAGVHLHINLTSQNVCIYMYVSDNDR